ncbi:hypothetical protein AB0L41_49195 [Amycolatopsis mediterranei]|uniref:hypothetical protein n=1 Tax=Amycolatopsis mediterranei TaxID=33910 RepID=UPI003447ADA6
MTGGGNELAELSVRVVLYHRNQDGELSPVYPDSDDLLESATVLAAPINVPAAVVRALLDSEVPADFAEDPWLNRHRVLAFTNGRCRVAGYELRYHDKFGVYASEET